MNSITSAITFFLAMSGARASLQLVHPADTRSPTAYQPQAWGYPNVPAADDSWSVTDWDRLKRETPSEQKEGTFPVSVVGCSDGIIKLQQMLMKNKKDCARELGYEGDLEKSLLYEPNPTAEEKCLLECVLKRSKLMQQNNTLSVQRIGGLAEMVSGGNPLVVAIALATAEHCNKFICAANPCDAAHQINRCIANELKARKIKLFY